MAFTLGELVNLPKPRAVPALPAKAVLKPPSPPRVGHSAKGSAIVGPLKNLGKFGYPARKR